MANGVFSLHYDQIATGTGLTNKIVLEGIKKDGSHDYLEVSYLHFDSGVNDPEVLDGFLCAVVFYLMANACAVKINGPVSCDFIRNIRLFAEAWHCWLPNLYSPVEIEATSYIDFRDLKFLDIFKSKVFERKRDKKSLLTFSGGVDACFSLSRHAKKMGVLAPNERFNVSDVVLVHGFDVRFENDPAFGLLRSRVEPILNSFGANCKVVKTDIRNKLNESWEHSHGAQIASVLHQFSGSFFNGIIGSTEPYSRMLNSWGSHPATDHLLSGSFFKITHDGAGYGRTQKVKAIGNNPIIASNLKVCWQGSDQEKNCGMCEKCVRTKLNFIAAGYDIPDCFPNLLSSGDIQKVQIHNLTSQQEFESIIEYANANGSDGKDLIKALKQKIGKQ